MVHPKVRDKIPNGQIGPAKLASQKVQHTHGDGDANIAEEDELGVLGFIQRAAGVKVVDIATQSIVLALTTALSLTLVEIVASDIGHEVVGPTDKLL